MNYSLEITSEYRCLISKLQELLRHYKIIKRSDKNKALQERVKNKVNDIVNKLTAFSQFKQIEVECRKKIDNTFKEQTKKQAQLNNKSSKESELSQKSKPIQSKKSFGASSSFSHSSLNSSQSSNSAKQPTVQQKSKVMIGSQKPKIQAFKVKQEAKPQIMSIIQADIKLQVPQFKQTSKPPEVVPVAIPPKIQVKQNKDQVIESFSSLHQSSSSKQKAVKSVGSSISSIQNLKISIQKGNKSQQSSNSQASLMSFEQSQSLKDYHFLLHKPNSNGKEQLRLPQEEDSQKYSQSSVSQNTIDNIVKFCCENRQRLNSQLQFNEDIFDYIRDDQPSFVYLYGVNRPQSHKNQKLYVCTLMKFSTQEVFKCDDLFQKENKDFKNNVRIPIGLIIKGDTPAAIQPEHIKFLINLQCPFLTILVLKDYQEYDGILCHFHQSILGRIRITPRKQLGQCTEQLLKKTYALPFNQSFLPKEKTRYVITKSLNRTIVTPIEQAPNAIHIPDNQYIREQKNSFKYKLHNKFFAFAKPEFAVYFVNNGVVNYRKDFKEFESMKKEVLGLQPKIPTILSLMINRDVNPVKKEFLELAIHAAKLRDPMIFLHLNTLKEKKTVIISIKSDVTLETIEKMEPMQIKHFEKDNHLTYCVLIVNKTNFKEFEDPKTELTEMKSK